MKDPKEKYDTSFFNHTGKTRNTNCSNKKRITEIGHEKNSGSRGRDENLIFLFSVVWNTTRNPGTHTYIYTHTRVRVCRHKSVVPICLWTFHWGVTYIRVEFNEDRRTLLEKFSFS